MPGTELEILYEDNHLIAVNKPPLIATMGALTGEPNLVDEVKQFLKTKYNKPGNVYLGVVSRLDAFSTGIVVFAKTSKAAARLTKQFKEGQVEKKYLAIVEGRLADRSGKLIDWVIKNDSQQRMEVVAEGTPGARRAELGYRVKKYFDQLTLVEIDLVTGRKHQIRVQFSHLGHPVFGDAKYAARGKFSPGIALLSQCIKFDHPVRKIPLELNVEMPGNWNLRRFGNKSANPAANDG